MASFGHLFAVPQYKSAQNLLMSLMNTGSYYLSRTAIAA